MDDVTRRKSDKNPSEDIPSPLPGAEPEAADYVVSHLEEAIEKGWIRVFYQPLIRSISGELCGMEALARWDDPERGLLTPAVFIPPLEKKQKIWKLDLCVIRQAVEELAGRKSSGKPMIPVSINLSRSDFLCCDIFREIEDIVRRNGVDRSLIHIEMTESAVNPDAEAEFKTLDRFKEAGYELWMDDFGRGCSSLNLLKEYAFDVLKLDMEFLRRETKRSRSIVQSIIRMNKGIGHQVLSEGVENREQVEFLRKSGCDMLQGYYFGCPMPLEKMLDCCAARGIAIESRKQRACWSALRNVDFLMDVPLALLVCENKTFRLPFVSDRAMDLLGEDTTREELEKWINDPQDTAGAELFRAVESAIRTGGSGGNLLLEGGPGASDPLPLHRPL